MAQPLGRAVGDHRRHHPAVAVPDEDDVAQILEGQHAEHVLHVGLQPDAGHRLVRALAETGVGRREDLVAAGAQERQSPCYTRPDVPAPIILVTCAAWPEPSASDQCLAAALRARGYAVAAAPWNGPFEPFAGAEVIVVRSSWDYHEAPDAYRAWLDRLPPGRTFNAPELIHWNLSKAHVLDLGARGAVIPRSRLVAAEPTAVAAALEALHLQEAVIKPAIGASGVGVERLRRGEEAAALQRARAGKALDRVLVQEFVAGIEHGELAGVFFEGAFSHGLRRVPAPGEFRVNSQHGGRMEAASLPGDVVEQMAAVLALLPVPALYARVDGLVRDGRFLLMELEVNEPGLGMHLAPGSAGRFADALLARLGRR